MTASQNPRVSPWQGRPRDEVEAEATRVHNHPKGCRVCPTTSTEERNDDQ